MNKLLLILTLSVTILSASSIGVGSKLNELNTFIYETPYGREMRVPKRQKLIVVAFEKDTGALVNDYLSTKPPYYMVKNRALFIADISKMPTIITNALALPKMRKYKHLVYLHYGDEFQKLVPMKENALTLLHVDGTEISKVTFIKTKKELIAAIEK